MTGSMRMKLLYLIDWVVEYRERRQALLFCVDFMLRLANEEPQRQLSRSVTEWEDWNQVGDFGSPT